MPDRPPRLRPARARAARKPPGALGIVPLQGLALTLRREHVEVVDADHGLDLGDRLGDLLETAGAESLPFALLHLVGDAFVFVAGDKLAQGGEQVRLLARGMRAIHRDEGLDVATHRLARLAIAGLR